VADLVGLRVEPHRPALTADGTLREELAREATQEPGEGGG
jgi:hypothetical protein